MTPFAEGKGIQVSQGASNKSLRLAASQRETSLLLERVRYLENAKLQEERKVFYLERDKALLKREIAELKRSLRVVGEE